MQKLSDIKTEEDNIWSKISLSNDCLVVFAIVYFAPNSLYMYIRDFLKN